MSRYPQPPPEPQQLRKLHISPIRLTWKLNTVGVHSIPHPQFLQELWKLYMGAKSAPAPGARKAWLAALPALE